MKRRAFLGLMGAKSIAPAVPGAAPTTTAATVLCDDRATPLANLRHNDYQLDLKPDPTKKKGS